MGIRVCPCKGCTTETGRSSICHSNCEKYAEWKRELEEANTERRRHLEIEALLENPKKRHK